MIALWHRLPDDFEEQLTVIGRRAEAYHFDDGADDALRAADALDAAGLQGVFFIITGRIGTEGSVTPAMLHELVGRGHEIGNHTDSHRMMTQLPPLEVRDDIATAQSRLADLTGIVPRRFAWPNGRHDAMTDAVADEFGFVEARDISNVVRRIALKTPDELRAIFP